MGVEVIGDEWARRFTVFSGICGDFRSVPPTAWAMVRWAGEKFFVSSNPVRACTGFSVQGGGYRAKRVNDVTRTYAVQGEVAVVTACSDLPSVWARIELISTYPHGMIIGRCLSKKMVDTALT